LVQILVDIRQVLAIKRDDGSGWVGMGEAIAQGFGVGDGVGMLDGQLVQAVFVQGGQAGQVFVGDHFDAGLGLQVFA
jgi:hypothetical protein